MNRRPRASHKGVSVVIAVVLTLLVVCIPLTHAALLNLTYDANGNLVTGDGKYRTYNSKNQLVSIRDGNNASAAVLQTYVYHPTMEKMLVKKTYWSNGTLKETVTYISDEFVRVVNSSGTYNTTYYFDANADLIAQKNPDGTITTLLNDIEGSANVATNTTGGVTERTTYEPFGSVASGGAATRYTYEGKEADAVSGDIDFEFRKYNPDWGIFTQPDNVLPDLYDPQSLNRYAFERNNPMTRVDKTGHLPQVAVGFVLGAIAGAGIYAWTHRDADWSDGDTWAGLGGYAAVGAVAGAAASVAGPVAAEFIIAQAGLTGTAAAVTQGAAVGAIDGVLFQTGTNVLEEHDWSEGVAGSAAIGAVTGGAGARVLPINQGHVTNLGSVKSLFRTITGARLIARAAGEAAAGYGLARIVGRLALGGMMVSSSGGSSASNNGGTGSGSNGGTRSNSGGTGSHSNGGTGSGSGGSGSSGGSRGGWPTNTCHAHGNAHC